MDSKKNTNKKTQQPALASFPKRHLIAAAGLTVTFTLLLALFPSKEVAAKRHEVKLEIKLPTDAITADALASTAAPAQQTPLAPVPAAKEITVKSGDSLSKIFQRVGLTDRDVYEFTRKNDAAKALKRIHPGHKLVFHIDNDNKLQNLRYIEDRLNSTHFTREGDVFVTQELVRTPDTHIAYRQTNIDNSLFVAAQEVGLESSLIMELAQMFGWDIDFALDIRKGDSFQILYEERFLDGEKIGNGAILAAEFTNQGKTFKAVRYVDANNKAGYFTPDGKSMRKAFLRAPVDFRRISSNFNPRRLHPIHKTVRPHRGTDYAASRGTPVYASGGGRVIKSTRNRASGNYVVIQHSNNIQTKYLHLHKRKVRKGQRVSQKQIIGTVGSTGYSTAPHLHYEFVVNGVHRNPRTILQKLPKAKSIPADQMARFSQQTQPVMAQLQSYQKTQLATASPESH